MNNLFKIKKLAGRFYLLISSLLIVVPLYYLFYWVLINSLPETLITKNMPSVSLVPSPLSPWMQLLGFMVSLLPLSALIYGLIHIRKLFAYYKEGVIFSLEHVKIFKKTSKALIWWVFLSILYESAKSVLFSLGNPPGQRVISVGFSSPEITTLVVAGIVFVIAWVMEEARIIAEEHSLTV